MITLTEKAVQYISKQIESRDGTIGIRFGVTGAGCGGYSYMTEFVDEKQEHDNVYSDSGVDVFVDPKSLVLLTGLTVDYKTDLIQSGLDFSLPTATHCGCGESFALK